MSPRGLHTCPLLESLLCLMALVAAALGQGLAQQLSALHSAKAVTGRLEPCMPFPAPPFSASTLGGGER